MEIELKGIKVTGSPAEMAEFLKVYNERQPAVVPKEFKEKFSERVEIAPIAPKKKPGRQLRSKSRRVKNKNAIWNKDDDEQIKRDYPKRNLNALSRDLGRTKSSLRARANILGVHRDQFVRKAATAKTRSKKPSKIKYWVDGDIAFLRMNYDGTTQMTSYIATTLKRSASAVIGKAWALGLTQPRN
ncbi:hypothetical protein GOV11_00805 [Candidatus Woesearchaeota archaeon]|nr:hypothetical protein [Candidatus Woesearchaeota archaeon]